MRTTVGDLMTKDVFTVTPVATFKEMVGLINERRVSALPVVEFSGELVGIVSETDLMFKEELPELSVHHLLESKTRRRERGKAAAEVAADVMSSPAISTRPDLSVADAARLMHEKGIKHLPVVGPTGRLVGIISRSDLLKVFLREDHEIEAEIRDDLIRKTMWMDPEGFELTVSDGVVALRGEVDRKSEVRILSSMIGAINGVVSVDNALTYRYEDERAGFHGLSLALHR